jgi:hypothetical protein
LTARGRYAAKAAAEAGVTNESTLEADGERLEDPLAGSFDAGSPVSD